jgi:hypothetical protein
MRFGNSKSFETVTASSSQFAKTIKKAKHRRSDEARAAVSLITASASVENIVESRAKKSLARVLEVSQKRISRATTYKKKILHSESAPNNS